MTPAEEDALMEKLWTDDCDGDIDKAIRLAIRAAVAAERERCAKWHDEQAAECEAARKEANAKDLLFTATMLLSEYWIHTECAAAIRRGE